MFGLAMMLLGLPQMNMSRLWVNTTGNTRVQINQTVTDNNGRCTVNINDNQSNKDIYVQIFTQQKEMYLQMADTWDTQGRNTNQLRTDLSVMQQKIDRLNQEGQDMAIKNDINDLRVFTRQTIQTDIRSIMRQ